MAATFSTIPSTTVVDHFFNSLAEKLGGEISADHIKLVICLIATYPLALLYRKLPATSPTSKHLFSIGYALFTMVYILKFYIGAIHIALMSLFTYVFMRFYHGKNGPYINFVISLFSMSICHINRQLNGYEGDAKLDYSGVLMVITIKVSSFGFNVADGRYGPAATDFNKQMKIDRYPSLIEYFGWLCFFGGLFVGPTCEYMDYYRFTSYFFLSTDKNLSPYKPTLKKLMLGVVFASVMCFIAPRCNYFRLLEDEFLIMPFYKRFLALEISGFVTRCKFYFIWVIAEGSCILSGFGYNGIREGKHRWNRLTNIDWYAIETAESMSYLSNRWNRSSNTWVRHYVYMRLIKATPEQDDKDNRKHGNNNNNTTVALIASYITSSIWHGFHPGYYLFIVTFSIYQILGRRMRRVLRPLVMCADDPQKPLPGVWKKMYDLAGNFLSLRVGCVLTAPFELLYFSRTMTVWGSVYYFHLVGYVVFWIILLALEPTLKRIQKRRIDQAVLDTKKNKPAYYNTDEKIIQDMSVKQK